ncbi:MAG TPA: hypothetical protein VN436_00815 [Holophaga sp.]|nr:hypothetical protein [Holophaga sp.]
MMRHGGWLALAASLAMTGCFDSPVPLVQPEAAVRVQSLEGLFLLLPDHPGEGWFRIGGGQLLVQWNDARRSLAFDGEPRNPGLPAGTRASDRAFESIRTLPLDEARRIYLVQMTDLRTSGAAGHHLMVVQVDGQGVARIGHDEAWTASLPGFSEAQEQHDADRSLRLLQAHAGRLPDAFFEERMLVPVKVPAP